MSGRFLHELAAVERAQPRGLVTTVTLDDSTAAIECGPDAVLRVPVTAGRGELARLLGEAAPGVEVVAPATDDPETYPVDPGPEEVWSALLEDLGAYLPDLAHARPLRLVSVRRERTLAQVRVTDGTRDHVHDVSLDGGEMPAAVAVDIAAAFPTAG